MCTGWSITAVNGVRPDPKPRLRSSAIDTSGTGMPHRRPNQRYTLRRMSYVYARPNAAR